MSKCLRCGYEWQPRKRDPVRCPSCKSTRWNDAAVADQCQRCGATWTQRGDAPPKYCPVCHSAKWDVERLTYTCPRCGRTRVLRSNSRRGLCPVCDRYADGHRGQPPLREERAPLMEEPQTKRLWSDGNGLYCFLDADGNTVYVMNRGKLAGSAGLRGWCRCYGLDPQKVLEDPEGEASFQLSQLAGGVLARREAYRVRTQELSVERKVSSQAAACLALKDAGMCPVAIAMKLELPFSAVMDALNGREIVFRSGEEDTDSRSP